MNLNPFSSDGELSPLGLVITVVVCGCASLYASIFFRDQILSADLGREVMQQHVLSALWFVTVSVFFWMITTAIVKRWNGIQADRLSKSFRSLCRVFLLSPLLSIWFIGFTLMHSGAGLFDPRASRFSKVLTALCTLAVFHVCFLGYLVATKELVLTKSFSFRPTEKNNEFLLMEGWTPTRGLYVHFYPYLSPLSKLALAFYMDFRRSEAIYNEAIDGAGCPKRSDIDGVEIDDCFFSLYREHDKAHPFSTPLFGLMEEARYHSKNPERAQADSLKPFASTAAIASNLLWFLQPGIGRRGRNLAAHPKGLLPYISSPELCLLEIGEGLQRKVLLAKVLPLVKDPLAQMENAEASLVSNSTPVQGRQISKMIRHLRKEVNDLEAN